MTLSEVFEIVKFDKCINVARRKHISLGIK